MASQINHRSSFSDEKQQQVKGKRHDAGKRTNQPTR